MAHLVVGKVDVSLGRTLLDDWLEEQPRIADIILVVNGETIFVFREHGVLGSAQLVSAQLHHARYSTDLMIGTPVKLASWNALYHTGKSWYRNLIISRRCPLIGSS